MCRRNAAFSALFLQSNFEPRHHLISQQLKALRKGISTMHFRRKENCASITPSTWLEWLNVMSWAFVTIAAGSLCIVLCCSEWCFSNEPNFFLNAVESSALLENHATIMLMFDISWDLQNKLLTLLRNAADPKASDLSSSNTRQFQSRRNKVQMTRCVTIWWHIFWGRENLKSTTSWTSIKICNSILKLT